MELLDTPTHPAGHDHDDHDHDHDHAPPSPLPLPAAAHGPGQWLRIMDMDCVVEESAIRRALEPLPGIARLQFALPQRALLIDAPEAVLAQAVQAIRALGFDPQALPSPSQQQSAADCAACGVPDAAPLPSKSRQLWQMGGALGLALAAELMHLLAPEASLPWRVAGMALAVAAIALSGLATYRKGLNALLRGKLTISALMAVAVTGAFVIGQWPEAAMVMALYAIAEWLEGQAADRARNAIANLMELAPEQAEVLQTNGAWQPQPVAQIAVGSTLRIKAGERIALDGTVRQGHSAVNQAPVTGESLPVDKTVGDAVYAGTINTTGVLHVEATSTASNTTLARIIEAVEKAQASRAPMQAFVDRFAAIYTPAVFALALAVAVGGATLLGWPWLQAIYKALVVLVIACPCALVLSTPITVVSALAAAAKRGILIKGGRYLEQARSLHTIAFDKTGTLTQGQPRLLTTQVLHGDAASVLPLAAALVAQSNHPVSAAIGAGLQAQGVQAAATAIADVHTESGRGVQARLQGRLLRLGNARWMQEQGLLPAAPTASDAATQAIAAEQAQGRTVTLLADDTRVIALFAVADTVRSHAQEALAELRQLGINTLMLSGDHTSSAQAVGQQLGVTQVHGDLLPEHKLQTISQHQQNGATAMVGDGINDAPALAQADMGFAMGGGGTAIAMEAADIVIMNDDLRRVPETVRLSRRTHAVLWQNITLALGIKAVFFALAFTGHATMWMAVFADMGASLLVVFNGLRMLRWRG